MAKRGKTVRTEPAPTSGIATPTPNPAVVQDDLDLGGDIPEPATAVADMIDRYPKAAVQQCLLREHERAAGYWDLLKKRNDAWRSLRSLIRRYVKDKADRRRLKSLEDDIWTYNCQLGHLSLLIAWRATRDFDDYLREQAGCAEASSRAMRDAVKRSIGAALLQRLAMDVAGHYEFTVEDTVDAPGILSRYRINPLDDGGRPFSFVRRERRDGMVIETGEQEHERRHRALNTFRGIQHQEGPGSGDTR